MNCHHFIKEAKDLITKNKVKDALVLLKNYFDKLDEKLQTSLTMLIADIHRFESNYINGITGDIELGQITHRTLLLINQIEKDYCHLLENSSVSLSSQSSNPKSAISQHPDTFIIAEAIALDFAQKSVLVEALLNCQNLQTIDSIQHIINSLENHNMKNNIQYSNHRKIYLMNIVDTCLNYSGGLKDFIEKVYFLERLSIPMQKVKEILATV